LLSQDRGLSFQIRPYTWGLSAQIAHYTSEGFNKPRNKEPLRPSLCHVERARPLGVLLAESVLGAEDVHISYSASARSPPVAPRGFVAPNAGALAAGAPKPKDVAAPVEAAPKPPDPKPPPVLAPKPPALAPKPPAPPNERAAPDAAAPTPQALAPKPPVLAPKPPVLAPKPPVLAPKPPVPPNAGVAPVPLALAGPAVTIDSSVPPRPPSPLPSVPFCPAATSGCSEDLWRDRRWASVSRSRPSMRMAKDGGLTVRSRSSYIWSTARRILPCQDLRNI
jgi:hypothetical protein